MLWHHLLSLDLVAGVRARDRPVDDLLPWLLTDARHAQPGDRSDFLWIRPLDIAGLLAARSYLVPGRLVVEVIDPTGLTGGRFALDAAADGACCVPTTACADITVGVDVLGSMYLGGYGVRTLAAAGLVDEHTPRAVARAKSGPVRASAKATRWSEGGRCRA